MHCAFHLSVAGASIAGYQWLGLSGLVTPLNNEEIVLAYSLMAAQDYYDLPIQVAGKLGCGYTQYGQGRQIFMTWLRESPPKYWIWCYHFVHSIWGWLLTTLIIWLWWPNMIWWSVFGYPLHLLIDYPTHHGIFRIKPFWPLHNRFLARLGSRLMRCEVDCWFYMVGWFFTRHHPNKRRLWRRWCIGDWDTKDWSIYVEYPSWVIFLVTVYLNLVYLK